MKQVDDAQVKKKKKVFFFFYIDSPPHLLQCYTHDFYTATIFFPAEKEVNGCIIILIIITFGPIKSE